MAQISFPDLFPILYVKESLISMAVVVGKPIHLDMDAINKTRPSYVKVEVQVDLTAKLS